jgi:exodeoxyribonuclease VIII
MIIENEPNLDYHQSTAISATKLKDFERSPAYYYAKHVSREIVESPSAAMVLGSAIHAALLEPEEFPKRFVEAPQVDRRTKAGKEDWAAFQSTLEGRDPLKADEMQVVREVQRSAEGVVNPFLEDARIESVVRVKSEYGWLQSRPDCWTKEGPVMDVKTIRDMASLHRQFWSLGYHIQDAFYRSVIDYETGEDPGPVQFIFVETQAPFQVARVQVDEETSVLSRHYVFSLLERLWECRRQEDFPGRYDPYRIEELSAPGWLRSSLEETAANEIAGFQALAVFEADEEGEA